MRKLLLLIPLLILLTIGLGAALCRAMGWNVNPPAMLVAAGASLIAALLACVPLLLTRGATQASVSQAALGATVIHMFGLAAAAGVVVLGRIPLGTAFTFWLLAFYFATLIGVVTACIAAIRSAPVRV